MNTPYYNGSGGGPPPMGMGAGVGTPQQYVHGHPQAPPHGTTPMHHHPPGHPYPPGMVPPPPPQPLTFHQHNAQHIQRTLAQLNANQNVIREESYSKLKRFDEINGNIGRIATSMCTFFDEIIKDKQSTAKAKQTRGIFEDFLRHLRKVRALSQSLRSQSLYSCL